MILMRQCKLFTNLLIILLFLLPVHLSQQWHHENNNNLHPDSQSGLQILINCKPNYASETDFMFLLCSGDPRASFLEAYFFSLQGYSNPPEIKGRKKKKNTEEGEKRVVGEGERKEEREMKQSPRILLCALLCSTHLNQEKFCIFMAFSVSCNIKDNYILGWGTVAWQKVKILLKCQKAVFQFYTFLDDNSDPAHSKLCFPRVCDLGLGWAAGVTPSGCCHRGVNPAAMAPFWGLNVTSSHNKSSTTEKHLTMHFTGKLLTHFLPFWEAYFGIKLGRGPPLGKSLEEMLFSHPLSLG